MATDRSEKLDALQRWARRVLAGPSDEFIEQRQHPRRRTGEEISLIPFDRALLKLFPEQAVQAGIKDYSVGGMGVVCDAALQGEFFCGKLTGGSYLLVRVVWQHQIGGNINEYGLQVIDRYESLDELEQSEFKSAGQAPDEPPTQ